MEDVLSPTKSQMKFRMTIRAVAICALVFAAFLATLRMLKEEDYSMQRVLRHQGIKDVIRSPSRCALSSSIRKNPATPYDQEYELVDEIDLGQRLNRNVAILSDEESFSIDIEKSCVPNFTERLSVFGNTFPRHRVDIDFCFSCSECRFFYDGRLIGRGYFDPVYELIKTSIDAQRPDQDSK